MSKKKVNNLVKYSIYLIILLIAIGLAYSVYSFKKSSSGENSESFIVCKDENNCIATMHIHADIEIDVCNQKLDLPLEAGNKRGSHTHKERNLLHFEERLSYNNKTHKIIDVEPLRLKSFFNHESVNIKFSNECIGDKCNNDLCNNVPGSIRMFVNDVENFQFHDYVWNVDDNIKITFGGE